MFRRGVLGGPQDAGRWTEAPLRDTELGALMRRGRVTKSARMATSQGSKRMLIETVRFGVIEVDDDRLITFRDGLLGFREHKRFALIETGQDAVFFWLQSADDPSLAFVVCDPAAFIADYEVPIREDDLTELSATDVTDSQVLVIVNKVDGWLTANLLGPLVIGASARLGKQLVLADKRYGTRQPLREVAAPAAPVAKIA